MRVILKQILECEIDDSWYPLFTDPETQAEQVLTQFETFSEDVIILVEKIDD